MPEANARPFHVELIKPSHYDDDGYVIQWRISFIPSNSLASVYGLVAQAGQSGTLGVHLKIKAYDETHTVVPTREIIERIRGNEAGGVVFLTGVQTNQFPRAMDLARPFRDAGIPVVVGGFHVSGCLSMLPEMPEDLRAAQESGVSLFAGEAEGRMETVLRDAIAGRLEPLYDYMSDLPDLQGAVAPYLPTEVISGYMSNMSSFDAGRGCPFQCSFCTIINVQGRKSRWRTPDDIEHIIRQHHERGIHRLFITDDNFARNKNWEMIFDKLIELRRNEGIKVKLILQVDTLCHKIPGFVEKARQAGTNRVFIGLENINPRNLKSSKKNQNRIGEYRDMLLAWRAQRVVTQAGYILGFPHDTPASIEQDIATIKRELPIDVLEFFILTPLPGSEDHQKLAREGVWMDPDMNKYDLEHALTEHPNMSREELEQIYDRAWHLYYSRDHVETLMRRAVAAGIKGKRIVTAVMQFYGSYLYERVHPLQSGLFRIKRRTSRRPSLPRVHPLVFHPRRAFEWVSTYGRAAFMWFGLWRMKRRIERDPQRRAYRDAAITPTPEAARSSPGDEVAGSVRVELSGSAESHMV